MIEPQIGALNPKQYSPLVLAYMGDVVFELMIRERMLLKANVPVNRLHKSTIEWVCASAQSKAIDLIMENLSEEEITIYKRGRNANGSHVPKNADVRDYRRATGFEALFGFLYLSGKTARVEELFEIIWENLKK